MAIPGEGAVRVRAALGEDGDGDGEPFYVTESAGTWGTPTEIPAITSGGAKPGPWNVYVSTPTGGTSLPTRASKFTYTNATTTAGAKRAAAP